jgi:hypothetical protein
VKATKIEEKNKIANNIYKKEILPAEPNSN